MDHEIALTARCETRPVSQPTNWISVALLLVTAWATPAAAQSGPASLKAMSQHPAEVYIAWPPVPTSPQAYRVTRLDRAGGTEQVVAEGPATGFGEGNNCAAGSGFPNC